MATVDCMGFGWRRHKRGAIFALLGPVVLSSCAAAPFLIPVAFEFARNLFQTGLQNYGSKHRDNLSNLVNRLASPYMQNLPPGASAGPGMQGQPGMPQQQYPGQQQFPGQQAYPGQQSFPGQTGVYDPNNPYGSAGATYPGATGYPGTAQGYPQQPGLNPYGQQPTPPGAQVPYGQQQPQYGNQNPYGMNNPYGQPQSPYGTPNPYGGAVPNQMPQGYDPNNPYGQPQNPYGTPNPYGGAVPNQMPQSYDPNNPYGTGQTPQGYGQTQPGYGQSQSGYGVTTPYGTAPTQPAYGGSGSAQPYGSQAYGSQPYGSGGVYPRGLGSEPVAVDVAMIRQKDTERGKEVVLMNDGEVLKDGGANKEAGDRFKIVVRTNCDCYLYITSIDGSGWAEPIYPVKDSKISNPVKKDQEYAFPEAGHWYTLDQVKGIESFFVVASMNHRTDLEETMAQLATEKRPDTKIVAKVEEPPVIPRGVGSVTTRGILKVQDDTGTSLQVTPLSYAAAQPGQDVTVTRWFKHE